MTETRNTPDQDYIIDHVGAESWQQVRDEFGGWSVFAIYRKLNAMFPHDDNKDLAKSIYIELNWVAS